MKKQPLVALSSYPGSGNTWLRYLIEGITGIFTGSFYYNEAYAKHGGKLDIVVSFQYLTIHIFEVFNYMKT